MQTKEGVIWAHDITSSHREVESNNSVFKMYIYGSKLSSRLYLFVPRQIQDLKGV